MLSLHAAEAESGHYSRINTSFDKGRTKTDPDNIVAKDKLSGSACFVGQSVAGQSKTSNASVEEKQDMCSKSGRQQRSGEDVKMALTSPAVASDAVSNRVKTENNTAGPAAGAQSIHCVHQEQGADFFRPPQHTFRGENVLEGAASAGRAVDSTHRSKLQNSSQVREATDWDNSCDPVRGEEIYENYCKFHYGRSMKLGRQSSEPPRPSTSCYRPRSEGLERRPKKKIEGDWAKDESMGAIVPCLSPDRIRKSEKHNNGIPPSKAHGEFYQGPSEESMRLSQKANKADLRGEYSSMRSQARKRISLDDGSYHRSFSVPTSLHSGTPRPRNPLIGEGQMDIDDFSGRMSPAAASSGQRPAGMSSLQMDTGAAVSTSIVNTDRSQPRSVRGRPTDHHETPIMKSVLQNTVAKDMDRIREYREAYDRPFADLCSAFQQIHEAQRKEASRIKAEVNPQASQKVAALMSFDPTPRSPLTSPSKLRSPSADVTMKLTAKEPGPTRIDAEQPAFGARVPDRSSVNRVRAQSPAGRMSTQFAQSSLNISDALRWVC
jgi:hypothetical protein